MKKIILGSCLFGMLMPAPCFAQKNYPALFDKYLQAQVSINEFSGVVLVAQKGNIIYKKAFGYAEREWKIPNTVETKFEIGSLTKQFTATAILQLAEEGKLSLDNKLSMYYPGYPKGDSITLHMLLSHTSGIADYTGLPEFYSRHTLPLTKDSVIALFRDKPFTFSPGTKWSYSNSGYFLLGCIIEKVTQMPYELYLQEKIIKKIILKNTAVNRIDSILSFRAKGYSKNEKGRWKNADYFSMELPFSAGAMISTVNDLYQWQNALLKSQVISSSMLTKMITPWRSSYGYGLLIDSFEHHQRISHGGAIPGFTSWLGCFPSDDISIVVLSNNDANANAIGDALASTLFGLTVEFPHKALEKTININVLAHYTGKYQLGGTTNFELLEKNGKLYLKPEGGGEMELKSESETRFFFARDPEQEIAFITGKNGIIIKSYFINKGSKIEIRKLN